MTHGKIFDDVGVRPRSGLCAVLLGLGLFLQSTACSTDNASADTKTPCETICASGANQFTCAMSTGTGNISVASQTSEGCQLKFNVSGANELIQLRCDTKNICSLQSTNGKDHCSTSTTLTSGTSFSFDASGVDLSLANVPSEGSIDCTPD